MNQEQVLGAARNLTSLLCGIAIGHGWINADQASLIGGLVVAIAPLVWTYLSSTNAGKVRAASTVPEVKSIVVAKEANGTVADMAADPAQTKIVKEQP